MGTERQVEGAPLYIAETLLIASSSLENALQGVDTTQLADGTFAFVRKEPAGTPLNALYRFARTSSLAASVPTVVVPVVGPGRWLQSAERTRIDLGLIRPGAGVPSVEAGPTSGYLFDVGMVGYREFPLDPLLDRSQGAIVGFGWTPSGSTAGRLASWELIVNLAHVGKSVVITDVTKQIVDTPVNANATIYQHGAFLLTESDLAIDSAADEIHVRLQRIASSNDPPPNEPLGVHHVICIQPLL